MDNLQPGTAPKVTPPITHIVPTVGRVVWYWPNLADGFGYDAADDGQPFRADICHVNEDGTLNVSVNDHGGRSFASCGITLHQGDADGCSLPRPFATWMPYQKAMTEKVEAPAPCIHAEQVLFDPERGQLWPALDLQRELLAEQVRQLRLMNDAQELSNEQQRASMRDPGGPGKPVDPLPEVPGMPPHQVRMRFERDELNVRIMKAEQFMGTPTFTDLDETERDLLIDQVEAMRQYREILQQRIALFQEAQDNA